LLILTGAQNSFQTKAGNGFKPFPAR